MAGLALAALGWGLDTQTRVETDISKLVPQNARVTKEGLTAAECMLVGATHPDPAHPHERLAFARRPRKTHIDYAELTRFI